MPRLRSLVLHACLGLRSVGGLGAHPTLRHLSLKGSYGIGDLSPLLQCPRLECLILAHCGGLSDQAVQVLADCPALRVLDVCNDRQLRDLAPLGRCPSLRVLHVAGCAGALVPPASPDVALCEEAFEGTGIAAEVFSGECSGVVGWAGWLRRGDDE